MTVSVKYAAKRVVCSTNRFQFLIRKVSGTVVSCQIKVIAQLDRFLRRLRGIPAICIIYSFDREHPVISAVHQRGQSGQLCPGGDGIGTGFASIPAKIYSCFYTRFGDFSHLWVCRFRTALKLRVIMKSSVIRAFCPNIRRQVHGGRRVAGCNCVKR